MKKPTLILILSGITLPLSAQGTGLDPFSRDEDISAAQLSVDVKSTPDGLFAYNYTLTSPATNKGVILSLDVDISCPVTDSRDGLPPQDTKPGYEGDHSPDGRHSAISFTADLSSAGTFAIDALNQVSWGISLQPGDERPPYIGKGA